MSTPTLKPLNGTKTHPLSEHARNELADIAIRPVPRQSVNPGVVDRLMREGLVAEVMLMSPFKTHKGRSIPHLMVTSAGRERLGLTPPHGCGHMQGRGAA